MAGQCPICGKPTRIWYGNARKDGLCGEHADMLKAGNLVQCENCGRYHDPAKPCICLRAQNEESDKVEEEDEEEKKHPFARGKCLICGYDSGDNYLCSRCYYKYKEKTLYLKLTKCQDIELVDEGYEGTIKCKDGHMVKSYQEMSIDDYLTDHGIRHAYERTLIIKDEEGTPIKLHPDFYLFDLLGPGKDVWLEHWGINEEQNQSYKKTKKYKIGLYRKHLAEDPNFTLITTSNEDSHDIGANLGFKLDKNNIIPNTIDGKR